MAINPLLTNSTLPTTITEKLSKLLVQLPQSTQIPATIKLQEGSTLLKIIAATNNTINLNQTNNAQTNLQPLNQKSITLQIPKINIPSLNILNVEIPVVVSILQKQPVLKLQLALLEALVTKQNATKSSTLLSQQTTIKQSTLKQPQSSQIQQPTITLAEINVTTKLKTQIKLLISKDLSSQQITTLTKNLKSKTTTKAIPQQQKVNQQFEIQKTQTTDVFQKNISSIKGAASPIVWPQHAAMERLSQSIITSKLIQLNQQLPTNINDPFVKVLQNWIKQLVKTTQHPKFLEQFMQNPKLNPNREIKASLKQQAPLWEATVRKQNNSNSATTNVSSQDFVSSKNVKAQLIKIIQSFPVILSRLSPSSATQVATPETEIWQMIFKTQKLIQQQLETSIPSSGNINQSELAINFLEQNLRLLILWLKNIEQQQSEQHTKQFSSQQSSQQQSSSITHNNFRFELPMPNSNHSAMVKIEIEEQQQHKLKKKNKWRWKLTLNFDFGENRKLVTKTHVNPKQALIQFEGSQYYQKLITQKSMNELASSLENKTGLSCTIDFQLEQKLASSKPDKSFNLEA